MKRKKKRVLAPVAKQDIAQDMVRYILSKMSERAAMGYIQYGSKFRKMSHDDLASEAIEELIDYLNYNVFAVANLILDMIRFASKNSRPKRKKK